MNEILERKLSKISDLFAEMQSVIVAFSGGVDSTFLLKVAHNILKGKVLAVNAVSDTYSETERRNAENLARDLGVNLKTIYTDEISDVKFISNPPERCYYCKYELFSKLLDIAKREGYSYVVHGATIDDTKDFRPGQLAAKELGIRAPLIEADLTKEEVRELSREMDLPTWNKPSMACLASRFPYGEEITQKKLQQIKLAEECISHLGFSNVRVRFYGKLARVEVDKKQLEEIISDSKRKIIIAKLKEIGFTYVTIDLEGFRSGSMNEALETKTINLSHK